MPNPKPVELYNVDLSVVVTVYSETFSITETVEKLLTNDRGYIKEILLVIAPKSQKASFEISEQLAQKYSKVKILVQKNNPGLGWAYREGMEAASGNYVALMSADLETEPEAVDRMVKKLEKTGADGVVASRWLKGGGFVGYSPSKKILNWLFQKIFKVIYRTNITDLSYGFKILSSRLSKGIFWEGTRHEICLETTLKPLKLDYYIEQVPSVWVGRREGASFNNFLSSASYLKMALRVAMGLSRTKI